MPLNSNIKNLVMAWIQVQTFSLDYDVSDQKRNLLLDHKIFFERKGGLQPN